MSRGLKSPSGRSFRAKPELRKPQTLIISAPDKEGKAYARNMRFDSLYGSTGPFWTAFPPGRRTGRPFPRKEKRSQRKKLTRARNWRYISAIMACRISSGLRFRRGGYFFSVRFRREFDVPVRPARVRPKASVPGGFPANRKGEVS
jgi:hypothetical protein